MGRHWQNIKLGKGKADAARGAKFTQLGRAITMAAKEKGGDPDMNAKLSMAIQKAKEAFMPKDNIERAIKKGTGELVSEVIEELQYEGYGPGGAAILAETVTDNRNRTIGNVKNAFSKNGGNLGAEGSVAWMFERKGVISISNEELEERDADQTELDLIEAGAEDIRREDGGWSVITAYNDLHPVREKIMKLGIPVAAAEHEYLPKDAIAVPEEQKEGLQELIDALESDEDVKAVYTNARM